LFAPRVVRKRIDVALSAPHTLIEYGRNHALPTNRPKVNMRSSLEGSNRLISLGFPNVRTAKAVDVVETYPPL
jgi:hypothetical protein